MVITQEIMKKLDVDIILCFGVMHLKVKYKYNETNELYNFLYNSFFSFSRNKYSNGYIQLYKIQTSNI